MEIIEANKKILHTAEVKIRDLATVRTYDSSQGISIDFTAEPLELLLFCTKQGKVQLHASFIPHPLELSKGEAIFLAFPKAEWNVRVVGESASELYTIRMQIGTMHRLINPSFDSKNLSPDQRINTRDLMRQIPVSPTMLIAFEQLLYHKLNPPFQALFEEAKFLEIFSLLMESAFGQPADICPVAMSPAIEHKLGLVRQHIMENIEEVPDPERLALQFELPRNTLKEGYKFKYGKSIHQFHSDHKLEFVMQMLTRGEMLVKEIAFKIGYQNPSHFIAAFKKKYGYTPKQFFKREAS